MENLNKLTRYWAVPVLLISLVGCGGGGSSSSGGGNGEINNAANDSLIRIALGDANYQPTQAERNCVAALDPNSSQSAILKCVGV
jgi:hypothetical protein